MKQRRFLPAVGVGCGNPIGFVQVATWAREREIPFGV
jgi:hypothetical protein